MKIETKRLEVFPLNYALLGLYLANNGSFEAFLRLKKSKYEIPAHLIEPLKMIQLMLLKLAEDDSKTHSLWIIIDKKRRVNIGSFMFKNKPNKNKTIEIGYGIEPDFQNQGYMTEALIGIVDYCKKSSICKKLKAETLSENIASQKVLQNAGFKKKYAKKVNFWFEIDC